jgi:serine/threonine-protein kinase
MGTSIRHAGGPVRHPTIDGYEIIESLGQGGMGVVYRARNIRLQRTVAVKMLAPGSMASTALHQRFERETKAIANLQHPNIAQLYESGESAGIPWFAMELLSAGSLADRLRDGPMPPIRAAREVEILARAVSYFHRQGIIHRDLKPQNILIADDGTPKITDFGIAKQLADSDSATRTGDVLGTPSYMAPEQASGIVKQLDAACDIYALGAILYHCLCGVPPFRGPDPLAVVMQVLADDPIAPRRLQAAIPRDIETICLKCLEKVPR